MGSLRNYIILFFVLVAIAIFFWVKNSTCTFCNQNKLFNVSNPESITQVTFTANGQTVSLTKVQDNWLFNNQFNIKKNLENTLLNALSRFEIQSQVTPDSIYKVTELLTSSKAAEVFVYNNSNVLNHFYIVSDTVKQITYIANTISNPFILKISGFGGNIARLFNPNQLFWRSLQPINYNPNQIKSIEVQNANNILGAFIVANHGRGQFGVHTLNGKLINKPNIQAIQSFVRAFSDIPFKSYIQSDSLISVVLQKQPQCIIKITNVNNTIEEINVFNKNNSQNKPDLNYCYVYIVNSQTMGIAAYKHWDFILKDINYFK